MIYHIEFKYKQGWKTLLSEKKIQKQKIKPKRKTTVANKTVAKRYKKLKKFKN